jgi:Predicted phosphatase homologous to the C-terminal domain of histone macroH2A1
MNSLTSSNPVDKTRENDVQTLIHLLLKEMPEFVSYAAKVPPEYPYQRMLLRGLMNLRSPMPLDPNFLALQDKLLQEELQEKGVIDVFTLPGTSYPKIALYQGDITKLKADAIVNAANSQLLGCFVPGHRCIDNAIHSAAGLQLREECAQIMRKQGHEEPVGLAKLTKGYNLPCRYVIHTVGPTVEIRPTSKEERQLAQCYLSCLSLAESLGLKSIVFPCISTGEFGYPKKEAAKISVETVDSYMVEHSSCPVVVFDTFKDEDYRIYNELLG